MTQEVYTVRLAPDGPVIGNPPVQVGNSAVAGREWGANGAGANANVPGTLAADVAGLESVVVDMKPSPTGYRYDIMAGVNTFGTGGGYTVNVYGSTDGGATFPIALTSVSGYYNFSGVGLKRSYLTSGDAAATINRVKVQLQRNVAADVDLQYSPPDAFIVVREISPTS